MSLLTTLSYRPHDIVQCNLAKALSSKPSELSQKPGRADLVSLGLTFACVTTTANVVAATLGW